MSTKIWMIRLRPIEPFYFGGANHFSAGPDRNKPNYLSKSNYFPQQTALLGMLRYILLEQGGKIPLSNINRNSAKKLVGGESFDPELDDVFLKSIENTSLSSSSDEQQDLNVQSFGQISRISPVFIQQIQQDPTGEWATTKRLFRNAREYVKSGNKKFEKIDLNSNPIQVSFNRNVWQNYNPPSDPYTSKSNLDSSLIDWQSGDIFPFDYSSEQKDGLFIEDWRIGIVKKDRENAFYKQCFYRFAKSKDKDYCFTFYAEIDDSVILKNTITSLGGDRSSFEFYVKDVTDKNNPLTKPDSFYGDLYQKQGDRTYDKLVLLSDTRVNPSIYSYLRLGIVNGQSFRNNRSSVTDTKQFGPLTDGSKSSGSPNVQSQNKLEVPMRSKAYYLMSVGTVLYSDQIDAVKAEIDKFLNFKNIGYNNYIFIPKTNS